LSYTFRSKILHCSSHITYVILGILFISDCILFTEKGCCSSNSAINCSIEPRVTQFVQVRDHICMLYSACCPITADRLQKRAKIATGWWTRQCVDYILLWDVEDHALCSDSNKSLAGLKAVTIINHIPLKQVDRG
jgi:hypothetical protein